MAYTSSGSSSSSDSEVDSCSKSCVKAYATLKEQYDNLNSDYNKSQFNLVSYKAVEPKTARENSFIPPIIEDWNSDDESKIDYTVRPSIKNVKFIKTGKINTAGAKVITVVRPVNTVGSKPTVNHPRPISNAYKKGYSQVTRSVNKFSANKNCIFNKKVNTSRVKDTTARDRVV
ncbi:hypothetical protein Tco_1134959, partial [Tanacetum coccineum]